MKKVVIILLIVILTGCSSIELSPECERYSETKQISKLAGIKLGMPAEVYEQNQDCFAKYTKGDTSFELYYWHYSSDNKFDAKNNHSMIRTSNCKGIKCNELYEFHYIGPPRDLEVKCKQGKIWMNDQGKIREEQTDCSVFNDIDKYNQKTWKCEYNLMMDKACK